MIGTTISHFRILDLLGKGGMGEVYRAEDTTLNRQVAIKVLPELLAHDPERLARFEREARLLATLNHPNIATIYGLEEADGKRLLILELVEGETLAERIKKGPIPVEEALHLALQITEGLEAAHEKGIIHRDLKPGNIKLTPEGKIKILDLGLAKAFEKETPATDASHSPTLTDQMTHAGVILGTAAYMSPEQAKGKAADKRADIWAFGAVLYEMLTGKRAFEGDTITVTLGAIIHKEPDWATLPVNISTITRSLLRKCLKKNPHHRLHDVADARIEIEEAISDPMSTMATGPSNVQPGWKRVMSVVLGALVVAVITGIAVWNLKPPVPKSMALFDHDLPNDQGFTRAGRPLVAVSPDGSKIVYVANQQIYLRNLDEIQALVIQGTNEDPSNPFFSPDSNWVGYFSNRDGQLKKVPITGGATVTLCDASNPLGANWGEDGSVVFGQREGVMRVSSHGGTPELLIPTESGQEVHGPTSLAGW